MKNAVLIGNKNELNLGIAADLKEKGMAVCELWADLDVDLLSADAMFAAAKDRAPIDLLIVSLQKTFDDPALTIEDPLNYEALKKAYDYNTLGVIRAINAFLPLLEKGEGKRIAVITNRESSNNLTRTGAGFGDHMAHAPLNMAMNQLFNGLRPEGYTFRLYVPENPDAYDPFAAEYILRNRSVDAESHRHSDEDRLVLRDAMNLELPW